MSRDPILDYGNIMLRVLANMQQPGQLRLRVKSVRPFPLREVNISPSTEAPASDYWFVQNDPIRKMDAFGLVHSETTCPSVPGLGQPCGPSGKKQSTKPVTSNGCGSKDTPWVPDNPIGLPGCSFASACDYHDCCYGTCGAGKAGCDGGFLGRMLSQCVLCGAIYGPVIFDECNGYATAYYLAVWKYGGDPYDSGQADNCEDCCPFQPPQWPIGVPFPPF